jgi:linoleoyl-CoA desaturase
VTWSRDRFEPWRDWAALAVLNHGMLLTVALLRPGWPWLVLIAVPLGVTMSTATLTVLHDAGHRRLAKSEWPNVLAVQTAAPVGLWVGHWTLKHRVHHRVTQVYPLDDATRASGMVRLHPGAPRHPIHRFQQYYAWPLYGLAWLGEIRSQVTYMRTGVLAGIEAPGKAARRASFAVEKLLCLAVLAPYFWLAPASMTILMLVGLTIGSILVGIINVVGHINIGLSPTSVAPRGKEWAAHIVATTASFSTGSLSMRWLTGGLTHHLAHHLRPIAPRAELPALHSTVVPEVARNAGVPVVEYPTLGGAIRGHFHALRVLGSPALDAPLGRVELRAPGLLGPEVLAPERPVPARRAVPRARRVAAGLRKG